MPSCCYPNGTLDTLARKPMLEQRSLVGGNARPAAVDGRDRERQQLKILFVDARVADDVHSQPRRHLRVLGVLYEVQEPVVDVVHTHYRGRRTGTIDVGGVKMGR